MAGMLAIFGFIRGLSTNDVGHRSGPVATVVRKLLGSPVSDWNYGVWGGAVLISVILIKNGQGTLSRFYLARFFSKLNQRITARLYDAYLNSPYDEYLKSHALPAKEQINGTYALFGKCFTATAQVLSDSAILLMIALLLAIVDPWLTLGMIALFGAMGTALHTWLQSLLKKIGRDEGKAKSKTTELVDEGIAAFIDVRLKNAARHHVSAYRRYLANHARAERRTQALRRLPRAANEILLVFGIVLAVIYVVGDGNSLSEALPTMAIFGFAGIRANGAMSRIHAAAQVLRQKADEFEKHYDNLVRLVPNAIRNQADPEATVGRYFDDEEPFPKGVDGRLHKEIVFERVDYTYPGASTPALKDISLTIPRGSFVSFCGPSGGGKSTLLSLILGMLEPQSGTITCDGWPIRRHIRAWHRNIGYVNQNIFIARGTIRKNVCLGTPLENIDENRVREALAQAQALEFVNALPRNISTKLKKGGKSLSGGQRQRLVIARALYEDPDILIFDEATAALDNITEREIGRAIEKFRGQKTIICVAHRLSTIRDSDRIYVIDGGKIVVGGTAEWLLENSPLYREMSEAGEMVANTSGDPPEQQAPDSTSSEGSTRKPSSY